MPFKPKYSNPNSINSVTEVVTLILKENKTSNDPDVKKWCLEVLDKACRMLELFIDPYVSQEALNKATPNVTLVAFRQFRWKDQPKKSKLCDQGRTTFHYEHVKPVADIKDELLNLPVINQQSVEKVLRQAEIAWILKKENANLPSYRRGPNPLQIYADKGIKLL